MDNVLLIKSAASGRWRDVLSTVGGIDPTLLDGRHHPCPRCGGKDRFRLMDESTGACICNQCFRERNGDGIAAVQWMTGWTFPETLQRISAYLGIPHNGNGRAPSDIVAEVASRKRIPLESFRAFGAHAAKRGKLKVCRVPMFDEFGSQCSHFDIATIDDKWLKGLAAKGKRAGLFLADAKLPTTGDTVLIVEGVKDAAALHSLGFTTVGLSTCKMLVRFSRLFSKCHVVVVPDRDTAGVDGANVTAGRLARVAASVSIAALPSELKESGGADVRDILAQPDGENLLRQAIADAVEWEPVQRSSGTTTAPINQAEQQTDLGNARRFIALHGDNVLYCHPWGKWLVWDGCRWKLDDDGAVMRLAKAVADSVWKAARKTGDKAALQHAAKTASDRGAKALLSLAQSDVPVLPTELDANPWLLNCPNGTIDLRTGQLREHRREDRITKLSPTVFDPDAPSYSWDRFLEGVFLSGPIIEFVQRLFGYSLTGDQREQTLPILWGDGSNGKSTLLNAFMQAVGDDYAMQAAPDLLMAKRGESHPTDKADLFGRRIVCCAETDEGRRLSEALVKMLTGGEKVRARRMREDFWEFEPTHTVFLVTNHKPEVRGDDHAIWRRLALIPFIVRFWNPDKGETGPDELRQDKTLPHQLNNEAAGILAWAIRGCIDWQAGGLRIPDEVRAATSEYQTEQDRIAAFIDELCLAGSEFRVRAGNLYAAYKQWAEDCGEQPMTQTKFGKRIKARDGIESERSNGIWYIGLGLRDDR